MEMTKYAQAIKAELSFELAKQGSSIEEFEQALQNINDGAGVYKVAKDAGSMFGDYIGKGMNFAGSIPEMAVKGSLAGGALAGLTFDEMDKSVDTLNKALEKQREKVNLVRRITHNLRREHGL